MISIIRRNLLAIIFLACANCMAFGQATQTIIDPDADFKLAKEMYKKDQFSLAYPLFKNLSLLNSANSKLPVSIQLEAKYYSIVCGLQLNESASEEAAKDFVNLEDNAPRVQMMSFHLGEYYYRHQNFIAALEFYEKAGIDNLSNRDIADLKFHQAYSFFALQRFAEAKPLFNSIRQIPGDPNYLDANYYFGFISFYDKNYSTALASFKIVEDQPTYQKIVPYYITEILYFSGQKDKAIEYGEDKILKGGQYYDLQLRQLIGHAYFEKKNYKKSLPYLEEYVNKTDKIRREDLYELSYAYYETNNHSKAIPGFKELGGKDDSLAQNSMYLLADSYLKTNQKANARNAFLFSATNNSNQVQKEISKFHYAKLSFDLGYQDIALTEFQNFLSAYPNSVYIPEVKELLVSVLANTSNYRDALALYQSLGSKSENVKRAYPKILLGRAVELVNEQQIGKADELLSDVLSMPYNTLQLPYAYFWKGEIALRRNNYDNAIDYLNNYLRNPVTNGEVNVNTARYDLGYAYLQKENYTQAQKYFDQVASSVNTNSSALEQDAYIRNADAVFMGRNYTKAWSMYDNVINYNLPAADYATYQKSIISGANNRGAEKINQLLSIEQKYPSSHLIADANMEVANTYIADENYRSAIPVLNKIVSNKNAVAWHPRAYLKLGIAHFNLNNNNNALNSFTTLISTYSNSPESDAAVEYIRNIFIAEQKPAEFVEFMRKNGKEISYSEQDSLTYASANIRYQENDIQNALTGFKNYLNSFPSGRYAIDANYKIAEIYNTRKDYANALIGYEYVASKAPNKYAENSVLLAARINFFELKDYEKAAQYYSQLKTLASAPTTQLEAMRGLLRCQYKLGKWSEALPNAEELLQQKSIATDDKMMANMIIAKNYQLHNNLEQASSVYRTVIALGKSEFGAEARYQVASILFEQNKLAEAEKAGFEVINKAGSYEYWTTKAYILLGDIYWKQKDYFNAEATFKSITENASIKELADEAKAKLDAVIADKNKNSKVAQ